MTEKFTLVEEFNTPPKDTTVVTVPFKYIKDLERIHTAAVELVDGLSAHDIRYVTGIQLDECTNLLDIIHSNPEP